MISRRDACGSFSESAPHKDEGPAYAAPSITLGYMEDDGLFDLAPREHSPPPPAPVPQEPKRRGGRDFFHSSIWLTLAAGVASLRNEISVQNAQVARLESWLGKDANSMTCQDTALSKQHNQLESQAN